MKWTILPAAWCVMATSLLRAEPLAPSVLERYEQMLIAAPEPGTPFDRIYQHFLATEGLDALAARWSEAAEKRLEQKADFLLVLGLLEERRGRPQQAAAILREAAQLSGSWRAWAALAETEGRAGRLKEATTAYQKALQGKPPHDALARLYRGLALSQQREMDHSGAIETWQAYARIHPDDPFVLEEAGDALLEAGRYEEAAKMFRQLRDLKDGDPARKLGAVLRLAEVEKLQGNKAQALALYEAALTEAGASSWLDREVRSRIERLFRSDDDLPGLAAYYRRHLEKNPADVEAALRLSETFSELSRTGEALEVLQNAAEKAPDRKDIRLRLASALLRADRPAEARAVLESTRQRFPNDRDVAAQLGEALWREGVLGGEGKKEAAIATWRSLAPEGADTAAVQGLSEIFRAHQLSSEAVDTYRRLIAMDPSAHDRRERLAEYLIELDRRDEALNALRGMVTDGRASGETHLRLAKNLRRFGETAAARTALEEAGGFEDRVFDRKLLLWQIATEEGNFAEAERLAWDLRKAAGSGIESERADESLVETLREQKKLGTAAREWAGQPKDDAGRFGMADWRLLVLLHEAAGDSAAAEKALADGLTRFPDSPELTRLEYAAARRSGDTPRRLEVLTRLEKIEPQRAAEWKSERIRTLRESGRLDDAVGVAREAVALFPARADSHLVLADALLAAGKQAEAVTALREAVRLSENPNPVRFRLADIHTASGDTAAARDVMQEAFEAEDSPAAKLQMMNRLAAAYLQDGRVEQLIATLRQRQKAEQGGWRYALYLAEIYFLMQDPVRGREELDKALAGRPDDPALLRKLLTLAEESGDTGAALRYARMLAEEEPSAANRAQWGAALARDGKIEETLSLIRDHAAEFLEDPIAWQDVLRILQSEDKTPELAAMLEGRLRANPGDWKSLMALAEMLMGGGQTEQAAERLWRVVALKEDPSSPPAASAPAPASVPLSLGGRIITLPSGTVSAQSRHLRLGESYQRALQLLGRVGDPSAIPTRAPRWRTGQMPVAAPPTLSSAQDTAIVYLACIAAREAADADFIRRLQSELANRPLEERIDIYGMLQAPEPLLAEIEAEMTRGPLDPRVASSAYNMLQVIQGNRRNNPSFQNSSLSTERLAALEKKLAGQMSSAVQPKNVYQRYQWLMNQGKQDEAQKVVDEVFQEAEKGDPQMVGTAIQFAVMRRDFSRALALRDKLLQTARAGHAPRPPNQDFTLAMAMLGDEKFRKQAFDLLADEFASPGSSIPSFPAGMPFRQTPWMQFRSGAVSQFLPTPTADLDARKIGLLRNLGMNNPMMRKSATDLATRFAELAREKNSPALRQAAIWLRWFDGDQEEAAADMAELSASQADDAIACNAALMFFELKKPGETVAALDRIQARSGPVAEMAARIRLVVALDQNDRDALQSALGRMQGVRLADPEKRELVQALKLYGLIDEAARYEKVISAPRNPVQRSRQMAEILRERTEAGDRDEAVAIAKALLSRDPFSRSARGERHQQEQAAQALRKFGVLDAHIDDLKSRLSETPASERLLAQLVIATSARNPREAEPHLRRLVELRPTDPEWLQRLAARLLESDQHEEAMKMFDRILEENPGLLFAQGNGFVEPYRRTGSWARLVKAIARSPDPEPDPLNPYRQNYSHVFLQIGHELERARPPVDPADVWLKGLEWDDSNSAQLRPILAQSLARAGRRDEAREVIEEAFFPRGRDESSVKVFVFNRQVRPHSFLWNHWSTQGNGEIDNGAVKLMRVAHSLDLLSDLLPRLEKLPVSPDGTDPALLARLILRDTSVFSDVRSKLAPPSEPARGPEINVNLLRIMAAELADWPEGRALADECLAAAAKQTLRSGGDAHSVMLIEIQRADLLLADGKQDAARKALIAWRRAQKDWSKRGARMDFPASVGVLRRMALLGMEQEVDELCAALRVDPNFRQAHSRALVAEAENEAAILLGRPGNVSVALAWMPGEKGGRMVWDLRPGASNEEHLVWMAERPVSPLSGRYTLDVYFGTEMGRLKRVFTRSAVPARGTWTGSLPAPQGIVQAVLRKGDEIVIGPAITVGTGKVLTAPRVLERVAEARGGVAPGWTVAPPVSARLEKGGPLADEKVLHLDNDPNTEMVLVAERIPLDPNRNYQVGCWIRYPANSGSARFGWRLLDAQGREVTRASARSNLQAGLWNQVQERFGKGRNLSSLPESAAWLEPFVEFTGPVDLQGFFVAEFPRDEGED